MLNYIQYYNSLDSLVYFGFQGKFTFKNGRIYEGMFERDHIIEYPEFTMDGTSSPDLSNIRTRTPLPMGQLAIIPSHSYR